MLIKKQKASKKQLKKLKEEEIFNLEYNKKNKISATTIKKEISDISGKRL